MKSGLKEGVAYLVINDISNVMSTTTKIFSIYWQSTAEWNQAIIVYNAKQKHAECVVASCVLSAVTGYYSLFLFRDDWMCRVL